MRRVRVAGKLPIGIVLQSSETPQNVSAQGTGCVISASAELACQFVADLARAVIDQVHGHVGVDYDDVRFIFGGAGVGAISSAEAVGPDRAGRAAERAIQELPRSFSFSDAKGVTLWITGSNLKLSEASRTMNFVRSRLNSDCHVIYGANRTSLDCSDGALRVTLAATSETEKRPEADLRPERELKIKFAASHLRES